LVLPLHDVTLAFESRSAHLLLLLFFLNLASLLNRSAIDKITTKKKVSILDTVCAIAPCMRWL
jgi:hypothetical protein